MFTRQQYTKNGNVFPLRFSLYRRQHCQNGPCSHGSTKTIKCS